MLLKICFTNSDLHFQKQTIWSDDIRESNFMTMTDFRFSFFLFYNWTVSWLSMSFTWSKIVINKYFCTTLVVLCEKLTLKLYTSNI